MGTNVERCKYCGHKSPVKFILSPDIKKKEWECPECKNIKSR